MGKSAGFKVNLIPVEDTEPDEAAELGRQVRRALEDLPEVENVEPGRREVPEGARSAELLVATELLVALAPVALEAVLGMVRDILARPGVAPTEVEVADGENKVRVKFDPRTTSVDDIAGLVDRLRSGSR